VSDAGPPIEVLLFFTRGGARIPDLTGAANLYDVPLGPALRSYRGAACRVPASTPSGVAGGLPANVRQRHWATVGDVSPLQRVGGAERGRGRIDYALLLALIAIVAIFALILLATPAPRWR
jgi:hypothetical protein